ncbi:GGDEF domain-containing protein [Brachyspira sp. SAP_772]|uniref:GGDEF domain-containing protein n=1 Tax=Brachyspira sp. SAP_772 TaxID=2608385 RepID=UPI0012F51F40|nr:GGDEF domain-containing protein [Brachyspira sp. SAP_772]
MHVDIINYIKADNVKIIYKNTTFQDLISISSKNPPKIFVVTNANKKIFGVIIYNDLLVAMSKQMKKKNIDCMAHQNISKFISKNYIKVSFNANTNNVFDMMIDKKLDYAVVVDDKDFPIGIVDIYTLYDVIIKLKIRNIKLSVDNIELESSIEKDRFIKELKKEIDILNEQSIIDHITNLYNIRYFYKVIEEEAERAKRYKYTISLIFMDLDHFKNVNDIYGHDCGNLVLHEIGRLLTSSSDNILRRSDISFRYGGEEFVIICPNTNKDEAYTVGERIRRTIEKKVFNYESQDIKITVSIGISEYRHNSKISIFQSVKESDMAMYEAKHQGRNKVIIYDDRIFNKK